jgi:hypothetical protein
MTSLDAWRADAFVFRPVEFSFVDGFFDDGTLDDQTFGGVYLTRRTGPITTDLYWIDARRERTVFGAQRANETRHTFGLRLAGTSGPWGPGRRGLGPGGVVWRRAYPRLGAHGGRGLPVQAPLRPRFALRLSAASGDRNPADNRQQTFFSLFPYGGTLDDVFNLSMANVRFIRSSIEIDALPQLRLRLDAAWTRRSSDRDALYGVGGNVLRAAGASRALTVGRDAGIVATWNASRHWNVVWIAGRYYPGLSFAKPLRRLRPARNAWSSTTLVSYRF